MQTNPAVGQSEIIRWSESPCNQSDRKGKGQCFRLLYGPYAWNRTYTTTM